MKKSNQVFESILLIITLLLGLASLISRDFIFMGLLWLIPLGILQVIHSLIIGVNYWNNQNIRRSVIIYWIGVILNFTIMLIDNVVTPYNKSDILTVVILPLILAVYLWLITCLYKEELPISG